jgi:tRNA pseudouridine55 synthase
MNKVICVWKPIGLTPLQTLDKLRVKFIEYENEKLSYAGRLDPMAAGVMLVLVGEENKKREKYLRINKEYEFEVLFGITSDSYDLMGIPRYKKTSIDLKKLKYMVSDLVGEITQEYPSFSGKTIEGVKMFELAKKGILPKKLPKLKGKVYKAELLGIEMRKYSQVLGEVNKIIPTVKGDFRQDEILLAWNNLVIDKGEEFVVAKVRLFCSSGVFMRVIANELGKKEGGVALAINIKRLAVGKYTKINCIKI